MRRKDEELRLDVARRLAKLERLAGIDTADIVRPPDVISNSEMLRRLGRLQAQADLMHFRRRPRGE